MKKILFILTLLSSISSFSSTSSDKIISINNDILNKSNICFYLIGNGNRDGEVRCGEELALHLEAPGKGWTATQSYRKRSEGIAIILDIMYRNGFEILTGSSFDGDLLHMKTLTFVKK